MEEIVILPLPDNLKTMDVATEAFEQQFGNMVVYVQDHVPLEYGNYCLLAF